MNLALLAQHAEENFPYYSIRDLTLAESLQVKNYFESYWRKQSAKALAILPLLTTTEKRDLLGVVEGELLEQVPDETSAQWNVRAVAEGLLPDPLTYNAWVVIGCFGQYYEARRLTWDAGKFTCATLDELLKKITEYSFKGI